MRHGMIAAVALAAALPTSASAAAGPSTYRIQWRPAASPVAEVDATLTSATCQFRTSDHWADFFQGDRGWSRFIELVSANDRAGKPLVPVAVPNGWKLGAGPGPCTARIRYRVDFAFGRTQWEPGNEQVAYADAKAVYTTGLPLFLLGDDGPARVEMALPKGWTVTTPWPVAGQGRFLVPDQHRLIENTLVVGDHVSAAFHAQNLSVSMALLGETGAAGPMLEDAFRKVVARYVAIFADDQADRYMFVIIPGPEDGESYADSFAVATRATPSRPNQIIWSNHLAHELLHYWMGGKIAPAAADEDGLQWFTEGFTEYLANLTLFQTGVLSEAEYLSLMSRRLGAYVMTRQNPNFVEVSPQAAGAHKWRNRPLVYDGGATVAFCLDARIRADSGGGKSLADVMKLLYARSRGGEALSYGGIVRASGDVAGEDLSGFFSDYVAGTKTLDIEDCARRQGFEALTHGFDVFLRKPAD